MNVKDTARERTWQISLTHENGSRNWAPQRFQMYARKGLPKIMPQTLRENVQKRVSMSDIMQRYQKTIIVAWKMNTKSLPDRCRTFLECYETASKMNSPAVRKTFKNHARTMDRLTRTKTIYIKIIRTTIQLYQNCM